MSQKPRNVDLREERGGGAFRDRYARTAARDPEGAEITRLANAMPADETQLLYSRCLHGRNELGLAPDEYAAMTMVLLRLLAFKPTRTTAEKKSLNSAPASQKAPPPQASSTAQPATAPIPAAPAPVAALSQGKPVSTLPVVDPSPPPPQTEVLAVPVREQSEPVSPREQPQSVVSAGNSLQTTSEGDF